MKNRVKKLLIGIVLLMASFAVAWAAGWMTHNTITETDLSDSDDFMFRNVSVTPPAVGKNERVTWGTMREQIRTDRAASVVLSAPTAADDFCFFKNTTGEQVTIQAITGVLQSGTNVVAGLDICDAGCASCVAVDSDITFNGGQDADDGSLTNPNIPANYRVRWHTTSVSSPGFFTAEFTYK